MGPKLQIRIVILQENKNLKSLPVAFFSQTFNIDFTVYAHKMARFQNCVMLFKITACFPNIWSINGTFWYQYHGKQKSKKTPFLARPEPISNTVYNTLE